MELLVYALAGMFAALAGIMYASRMDAAQPAGEGWLMKAITAAILGGTSLKGGQGTILGTVFGTSPNGGSREWIISYERFGVLARESSSVPLCSLRYSETFCATELKLERDLPMTTTQYLYPLHKQRPRQARFRCPRRAKRSVCMNRWSSSASMKSGSTFSFSRAASPAASINRTGRRLVPSACYTIRGRRTTWPRRIGLRVTIWPRGYRSIR